MTPKFKRIMLKLSGEGLAGETGYGIDMQVVRKLAGEIALLYKQKTEVCVVLGGGNFFRGAKQAGEIMDRSVADQIGMMATVMNALTLKEALLRENVESEIFSGLSVPQVCQDYNFTSALHCVKNKVVIFAGGTGSPYFTTDTGAVLRALEMHCDAVLKATQVDGVYDKDPRYYDDAVHYDTISYDEVLQKHLNVMDMTAIALARDGKMPIVIFAQKDSKAIVQALQGTIKHTVIK